ncbi:MAG: hypothetical protein JWL90_2232 [Chthoniobacteraceae bacterium]|nr:hypothetical protein [Chthoniobacteraceae bacterium]MDB6172909.1 hypothetical protein [Chthoniobacteraceae bacterium]
MKSKQSRPSGRRSERAPRRSVRGREESRAAKPPAKKGFWQKLVAFFTGGKKSAATSGNQAKKTSTPARFNTPRKPEVTEVTSAKLYVGNLSFKATESDLEELFNGVGVVRTAEIVTHKDTDKSKGFGFVLMTTIDEAKRAVSELHDRDFLGRKLVVNGAKTNDREPNYRG